VIRSAMPEDAADLARVHVTTWQAAYPGMIDQGFLDSMDLEGREEWWERAVAREANLIRVAVIEHRVEGFCLAAASTTKGWGEVYSIYVTAEHWGKGLGRLLLAAGESALVGAGFDRALLWVLRDNSRARVFYERQGWALGKPMRIENIGGSDVTEVRYEKALTPP
jgi:GNAT superfamily N-acetyltransferase